MSSRQGFQANPSGYGSYGGGYQAPAYGASYSAPLPQGGATYGADYGAYGGVAMGGGDPVSPFLQHCGIELLESEMEVTLRRRESIQGTD